MKVSLNNEWNQKINRHPLFQGVSYPVFAQLMESCTLKNYAKGETILYKKTPRDGLFIILQGMAEVVIKNSGESQSKEVLEVLQTNDIVGFSSFADFLGEPPTHVYHYTVEVRAIEESICIQIPYSVMEERWHDENVRDFILRQMAIRLRDIYGSLAEQVQLANKWGESVPFIQRVQDIMITPVNTIESKETIQEAAKKMLEKKTTSVLVMDSDKLIGIVTKKDIVSRVVASNLDISHKVKDIISPKPITIHTDAYYYEALSVFLMNGVKHLPVVNDKKQVVGIITLSDLMRKKDRGTLHILQRIEESTTENLSEVKTAIYEVLESLINDKLPTVNILEVITKLYDRLVKHCIELTLKKVGDPPVPFSFYLMGSGGRGEQFLLTDQDHFLVYADAKNEKEKEKNDQYFKLLGEEIVNQLTIAGYEHCKGKMMSNDERWTGSLSVWKERLRRWSIRSTTDNVLLGQNFFSMRFLFGEQALHDQFVSVIKEQNDKARIFLYQMAKVEKEHPVPKLDHPIRALFRLDKTTIDIKKDGLFPFHHCVQLLAIKNGIYEGTPTAKIAALQRRNAISEDFASELYFAHSVIIKIRVKQAWTRYKQGEKNTSVIMFTHLKSIEKEELIQALRIIRSLQNHVLSQFAIG